MAGQLVCTDGQNVYATTDFVNFTTVKTGLSEFFQLRGKVIRDKLWLTNGTDPVMTWDGSSLVELDGTGVLPDVPKGKFIEYHDERVWMYGIDGDLSAVRFSALTNNSGTEIAPDNDDAWPSDNELQISEGDADIGTGIFLYRGYLYCSKQYSVWRIVGYDEYTYSRVKTRASTGTRFQESIQIKDNLVHFIGVDGLYVFDGEEAKRISDIIDPASSAEGVFAFRNLQQPLLNNQFWNVSETADLNAGTKPANLDSTDDSLQLVPADDTLADFQAGTHSDTDEDENPGYLQLLINPAGGGTENIAPGKSASFGLTDGTGNSIGSAANINNGSTGDHVGIRKHTAGTSDFVWTVLFGTTYKIGKVTLQGMYGESPSLGAFPYNVSRLEYTTDGTNWSNVSGGTISIPDTTTAVGSGIYGGAYRFSSQDVSVSFAPVACVGMRYHVQLTAAINPGALIIQEMQIFKAPFMSTGTFTSKSLDFGIAPATFGALAAEIDDNGESYQFFTQSSNDGSTWDAAVNVSNGGTIGSTARRYLRWGVTLNSSDGTQTPVIDKVYVGSTYISVIHNTNGNIFQWSPFQSSFNKAGQTITWYYRAATTQADVLLESWTAIVPGATPNTSVANVYIQIKIEFSTIDSDDAPEVNSFTVNWILDSGAGINTLQNVASIIILNRYWLAAATLGAEENDVVIVLGKATYGSPYTKKDFKFLSFCRYQDFYLAGSSEDGSIYRLETGHSKHGAAMDAYYETADFSKEDFQMKGYEILVTAERSGPYNLNIGWSTDGGESWTEKEMDLTRADGDALLYTKKFNIRFMSDSVRLRFRINAADQPFAVDSAKVYYRPTPQRGTLVANG